MVLEFKKLNSLFLTFVIIFISFFTTSQNVNADIIKKGIVTEPGNSQTGITIRSDATLKSDVVTKLDDGVTADVLDFVKDKSGNNYWWYKITFPTANGVKTGYIRDKYFSEFNYNTNPTFEEQLAEFPESYHAALTELHNKYPNWVYYADKLFLTFDQAVALEDYEDVKLIDGSNLSLRSMRRGCYDWDTDTWISFEGGWHGASRELIAYYMDPRNFLNENDIFMYMKQGYDSGLQTLQGVNEIVKGTFLDATITDTEDEFYNKTYSEAIFEAAVRSSVNPYIIASTILQEQGPNGATLGKGTLYNGVTVYNFMHWKATGKTDADIINSGASFAYNNGWTTPFKSILGGAKLYSSNYILKGQDTYFYKNYDLIGTNINFSFASHQYAQNVADSYNSANKLAKLYIGNGDISLIFRIPVYKDISLPDEISPYPEISEKLNNYYFKNIVADGLTPSFYRYTYEYSLAVDSDTNVYVELPTGATLESESNYSLNQGDNIVTLSVKAATGYTNNYYINVSALAPCNLTVTTDKNAEVPPAQTVIKGDTNGDGKISLSDLSNVRLHLLGKITLNEERFLGADTNKDGKISLSDLSNIRLHLIGKIKLN